MSLINDALKRAKQSHQRAAVPPPQVPLRPVAAPPKSSAPRSLFLPVIVAAILLLAGGILIAFALQRSSRAPATGGQQPIHASQDPSTASVSLREQASGKEKPNIVPTVSVPSSTGRSTPLLAPNSNPPPVIVVVTQLVETPRPQPELAPPERPAVTLPKLQGIVFDPSRPMAFLNGKSCAIGGHVGEFTIIGITKEAVGVEHNGVTNWLRMAE